MNVARILYPVQVLGPGKRVGIWVAGCPRRCKGCSNPELWTQRPEYEVSIEQLFSFIEAIARDHEIDGFTISGGDPMEQAEELVQLVKYLTTISSDILVYTGYRIDALKEQKNPAIESLLAAVSVLIDGEYMEELNDDSFLRGSSNQRVYVLNPDYQDKYEAYLSEGHNQIQNFTTVDGVVSVGIHHPTFRGLMHTENK